MEFNAEKVTKDLIQWLKDWFEVNGKDCNAVLGISGGKDSTVVAALCVEALGKDRVIGVLMPNHIQDDIDDSHKVCEYLGIKNYTIDIGPAYDAIINSLNTQTDIPEISRQTIENLPPRLRMSTVYAVIQSMNGRVMNTCNLSETLLSWETRWGDAVGDVSPLVNLTVEEVKAIGHYLNLPAFLVDKTPADGLCGSDDETKLGMKYQEVDDYIRRNKVTPEMKEKIDKRVKFYEFKRSPIPSFNPGMPNYILNPEE